MEKTRSQILLAYDAVIERVREMHEKRTGKRHGAVAWLGQQIGVSRQTIDNWGERDGFPPAKVPQVSAITGIPQKLVRPRTVVYSMPETAWNLLAPQELKDEAIPLRTRRKS